MYIYVHIYIDVYIIYTHIYGRVQFEVPISQLVIVRDVGIGCQHRLWA